MVLTLPARYVINLDPEPKVYTDVGRSSETELSIAEIVARSSNIGTITVQNMLGNERHHAYLSSFGLGRKRPGTSPARPPGCYALSRSGAKPRAGPRRRSGTESTSRFSRWQRCSPAIGNDGVWVEPHVVKEIIFADGSRRSFDPMRRPVLSAEVARTMQRLLQGVVESDRGTGWRAAVAGYTVGGKTGTTEKFLPSLGVYSEEDRVASFIGIAPISSPRIVVAVMLDTPSGQDAAGDDQRFGGVAAAPVFAEVVEAALHRLGVIPDAQ